MKDRPWLRLRKGLHAKAAKKHPERQMLWIGGILYFTDTDPPTPVPGVQHVPKLTRPVLGLKAHATAAVVSCT